ncbi:MAG: TetR/AcrR family transcriptional regulator [Oscillibacter sp.]|nr:TetR/AcrR family transcriptional regulator [Oscillibacter sp.]
MCKETFLRLPEEKRSRIINAAWDEFTTVSFANASINRIIRGAGIPRGSFYQYFEDKSDLFHYLMSRVHEQLTEHYRQFLRTSGGNLFRSALMGYDRFLSEQRRGKKIPVFERCIALARLNPGIDLETLGGGLFTEKERMMDEFLEELDKTPFRRRDTRFLAEVCCMTGICLLSVLTDGVLHPGEEDARREGLLDALDILRRGSYTEAALREDDFLKGVEM